MKNRHFKRLAAMLAVLPCAFLFTACGNGSGNSSESGSEQSSNISSTETPNSSATDDTASSATDTTNSTTDDTSNNTTDSTGTTPDTSTENTTQTAIEILSDILNRPNPWSFLPDGLKRESMAYATAPTADFSSDFVSVSGIADKYIGQELAVIYNGLSYAESALSAANVVYTAGEAIGAVYQSYINSNPESYAQFDGEITLGGTEFNYNITLDGSNYSLLAGSSSVYVELATDGTTDTGRIQVTDGATLKYKSSQNKLELAIEFSATLRGYTGVFTQYLTFERSGSAVTGYLYEYLGTTSGTGTDLARAYYYSDDAYTAVMSDAKDSGSSLTVNSYVEVYSSTTGVMLGARVMESASAANVSAVDYDTYWYNLCDVTGISSVKVTDDENADNKLNANTVYINGSTSAFAVKTKTNLVVFTSRLYDIELKTVSYVVAATGSDGTTSYSLVEKEIPMLFVQADELSSFATDVVTNNANSFTTVTPALPSASTTTVDTYYNNMVSAYEALAASVDYATVSTFIGTKNSYFDSLQ